MNHSRFTSHSFLVSSVTAASLVWVFAVRADALPPLPGTGQTTPVSTIAPPGVDMPPADSAAMIDHVKRGVVVLEQAGRTIGIGTVLGSDPRILTALSVLGATDTCDVRYADGHVVHARVGHKDAARDLALLIPLAGRYADGLAASEVDPVTAEIKSFSVAQNKATPQSAKVKGRVDAKGKDGTMLPGLLDIDSKTPLLGGTPLIDGGGGVVGVVVHVCHSAEGTACVALTAGEPIGAIRNFLIKTPVNAVPPSPWLGIQGAPDSTHGGVRVLATAPGSPAQNGGLKANDVIVSVDRERVDTPEKLQEFIAKHAVGESVKLQVAVGDKTRDVTISLRASP